MGTSEKKPQMKGCVCPSCSVFIDHKLSGYYFCIKALQEKPASYGPFFQTQQPA
ncbi:MAG: DUF2769 domain-containing protein [Halobacteriota archaeon]